MIVAKLKKKQIVYFWQYTQKSINNQQYNFITTLWGIKDCIFVGFAII